LPGSNYTSLLILLLGESTESLHSYIQRYLYTFYYTFIHSIISFTFNFLLNNYSINNYSKLIIASAAPKKLREESSAKMLKKKRRSNEPKDLKPKGEQKELDLKDWI
jgi:hypothetical protein